jgi:hypothetical protein
LIFRENYSFLTLHSVLPLVVVWLMTAFGMMGLRHSHAQK